MFELINKIRSIVKRKRTGESEGFRALGLSLVLFALTLRAALPLGLTVMVDEQGIPLVMCQQVAVVAATLADEDGAPIPSTPAYQCPFCMTLSADRAPLPIGDCAQDYANLADLSQILLPEPQALAFAEPVSDDNIGRDPPLA